MTAEEAANPDRWDAAFRASCPVEVRPGLLSQNFSLTACRLPCDAVLAVVHRFASIHFLLTSWSISTAVPTWSG